MSKRAFFYYCLLKYISVKSLHALDDFVVSSFHKNNNNLITVRNKQNHIIFVPLQKCKISMFLYSVKLNQICAQYMVNFIKNMITPNLVDRTCSDSSDGKICCCLFFVYYHYFLPRSGPTWGSNHRQLLPYGSAYHESRMIGPLFVHKSRLIECQSDWNRVNS